MQPFKARMEYLSSRIDYSSLNLNIQNREPRRWHTLRLLFKMIQSATSSADDSWSGIVTTARSYWIKMKWAKWRPRMQSEASHLKTSNSWKFNSLIVGSPKPPVISLFLEVLFFFFSVRRVHYSRLSLSTADIKAIGSHAKVRQRWVAPCFTALIEKCHFSRTGLNFF